MYEHNALGHRSSLAVCLTKVRSSRERYPATALSFQLLNYMYIESFDMLLPLLCFMNLTSYFCIGKR